MNLPDYDFKQNTETLEHLLGIVADNRDKRCAEVRERTLIQAQKILSQAHSRVRARLRRHISALREKYRVSLSAAQARNQTLIRQRQQKEDKACLDAAWPLLEDALLALWKEPESKAAWIDRAVSNASDTLLEHDWHIECPKDFTEQESALLLKVITDRRGKADKLAACDDIKAGIRISSNGTVVDATIEGLLQRRSRIEAALLARIKQDESEHD